MKSLQQIVRAHGQVKHNLRLGQYFCNTYIKESWPELYYEGDHEKAKAMIAEWLERHQYTEVRPQPILRTPLEPYWI